MGEQENSVWMLYAKVLKEVDLRKEHHPLARKTQQHPQLLEQALRQGGKEYYREGHAGSKHILH